MVMPSLDPERRRRKKTDPAQEKRRELTPERIWQAYEKGVAFKEQLNLYDTVKANEDFFIGKQWEGVNANGLPTPVFNFIKRVVLYLVATVATDNIAMAASPMAAALSQADGFPGGGTDSFAPDIYVGSKGGSAGREADASALCDVVNAQFDVLFEQNRIGALVRDLTRDAAVRGDGCIYTWFDAGAETGQEAKGAIRAEILENTRVYFGNPNVREVQDQPWIIISRREQIRDVRREAKKHGGDPDAVRAESDENGDRFDALTDDKVTTLTRFWKEDGHIWWAKSVKDGFLLPPRDTGLKRYPLVWMCWDHVTNCCHGQAAVTGLIPNQVFVNKAFAMAMISLMTTAYPKIVYDRTRVIKWDSGVGKAIPVNGDVNNVAKAIDPAAISPQIGEFIERAISLTKEFMGATDAALGNVRPDNTSAIIALQKSSQVPMELVKQDLFQAVEDLGRIWLDMMRAFYGVRFVEIPPTQAERELAQTLGFSLPEGPRPVLFDFGVLERTPLRLKLDVGGSAYWSEIAQIQTLENLLIQGKITTVDFLERLPNGYISNQEELIETLKQREQAEQIQAVAPAAAPVMA